MQNNETRQLKYSELLAVWTHFGLSQEWQTRSLPAIILKEQGDALTTTKHELIGASIRCEMEGNSYVPPPACKWCSGGPENCDKFWVEGHRQGWWVCSRCEGVFPCRHEGLEGVDELKLTATCWTCGMKMPPSFVAKYLHKEYSEKAETFRKSAESAREWEKS